MSKTTPVRWWRDDATRYQPRAYKAPEAPPVDWQLIVDPNPELTAIVADHMRRTGAEFSAEQAQRAAQWETARRNTPVHDIREFIDGLRDLCSK